jgi:molecular chaperone GrpE
MRGKHKKPGDNIVESIESMDAVESMPDDAVLPVVEAPAATESAATSASPEHEAEGGLQQDLIAQLQQALEAQKKLAADNLDKALRAQAELDNLRKRTARDMENAHKYALERFVSELLPVMDSMEMGITASVSVEDSASLKQGMDLTLRMLAAALEKSGVKAIDPKGEKFNPERHEAVAMHQEEGVEPGIIISVMQKGYELNGRLVRPAMVLVAK